MFKLQITYQHIEILYFPDSLLLLI